MKKKWSICILSALLCMAMLCSVPAHAVETRASDRISRTVVPTFAASFNEDSAPVILSDEEVSTVDLSDCTLLFSETITFIRDESGNIDIIEGDIPSTYSNVTVTGDHCTETVSFYKSGNNYYVHIVAQAKPSRWWVKALELSVLPTNATDWMVKKHSPGTEPNSYSITTGFSYPNGAPANVTAEVKWYVHTGGEYALEDYFAWSRKYTLTP